MTSQVSVTMFRSNQKSLREMSVQGHATINDACAILKGGVWQVYLTHQIRVNMNSVPVATVSKISDIKWAVHSALKEVE